MRLDAARGHSAARRCVNLWFVYHHQLGTVFTQGIQSVLVVNLHAVQAVKRRNVDGSYQATRGNVNLKYLCAAQP